MIILAIYSYWQAAICYLSLQYRSLFLFFAILASFSPFFKSKYTILFLYLLFYL
jgi:hypothetical protein